MCNISASRDDRSITPSEVEKKRKKKGTGEVRNITVTATRREGERGKEILAPPRGDLKQLRLGHNESKGGEEGRGGKKEIDRREFSSFEGKKRNERKIAPSYLCRRRKRKSNRTANAAS